MCYEKWPEYHLSSPITFLKLPIIFQKSTHIRFSFTRDTHVHLNQFHSEFIYLFFSYFFFTFLKSTAIALIYPLFLEQGEFFDCDNRRVATCFEISSPEQLSQLQLGDELVESVVVNFLDWQVLRSITTPSCTCRTPESLMYELIPLTWIWLIVFSYITLLKPF